MFCTISAVVAKEIACAGRSQLEGRLRFQPRTQGSVSLNKREDPGHKVVVIRHERRSSQRSRGVSDWLLHEFDLARKLLENVRAGN